ncbi:MAG: hypothetical protein KJ007_06320 [Burkholderiales bacterium]|nr:hypothetical protein [Burkholderiales bacterium]
MKLTAAVTTLVLAAAATAAWGHPGHGAVGEAHHLIDFLARGGILAVIAGVLLSGRKGDKDHD